MTVSSRTDYPTEEEVKNGRIKLSIQANTNKEKNKEWEDYNGQSTLNNQTKNFKPRDGKMDKKKVKNINIMFNNKLKKNLKIKQN